MIKKLTTYPLLAITTAVQISFGMQPEVKVLHAAQQATQQPSVAGASSAQVPTAAVTQQPNVNGKEVKAEAAKNREVTLPSLMAKIHNPAPVEAVDLNETDIILHTSFKENIEAQAKEGDDFILARVETDEVNNDGDRIIKYYEAHNILHHLFNAFPYRFNNVTDNLRRFKNNQGVPLKDPYRNLIHDITFYTYDHKKPEQGFVFLCSWSQLFAKNPNVSYKLELILSANQNIDKNLKYGAIAELGGVYQRGEYGFAQDYVKARELLEHAVLHTIAPKPRGVALCNLGTLYFYGGYGVNQDYVKSHEWYTQAANQTSSPDARATALFHLGELYYFGYGVDQDHAKARELYESSDKPLAIALCRLGTIYYNVVKDYAKTRSYYERAADQVIDPASQAEAWLCLGALYYKGNGVDKDYVKAREYLTKAAAQSHNTIAQKKAVDLLHELDTLAAPHGPTAGETVRAEPADNKQQ